MGANRSHSDQKFRTRGRGASLTRISSGTRELCAQRSYTSAVYFRISAPQAALGCRTTFVHPSSRLSKCL